MKKIIIIVLLFLYIYYPPIFPINTLHVLGIGAWIYIIYKNSSNSIHISRLLAKLILFLLIIILYVMVVTLMGNASLINVYPYLVWILDVFPFLIALVRYINKKYSEKQFYQFLLIAANIQGVIALLCFMFSSLQNAIVSILIRYGFSQVLLNISSWRIYGLTYNYTYSMPVVQALMAIISIYIAINYKTMYILFSPLLIFSGIINARISITVLLIGIVLIIITSLKQMNNNTIKCILIILLEIASAYYLLSFIRTNSNVTYLWIQDGYNDILGMLGLKDYNGYYSQYVSSTSSHQLPNGYQFLLGTGQYILKMGSNVQSDIGYINDIWYGGIIYVLLIYPLFIYIIMLINKRKNRNTLMLTIFILSILLVINIKGIAISINEFINTVFLFSFYYSGISSRKKRD